jgi:hypothetical protein
MNDEWAGPSSHDLAQPEDSGLADRLIREEFARDPAASTAGVHIHQEFAAGGAVPMQAQPPRSRSHRAGTLAGLGVVGVLLAVLVVVAPGGSSSKLARQTIHDVSASSPLPSNAASVVTSTVPPPKILSTPATATTTTTTTTRPAAAPATKTATLHCILGPIC